jgi:hypothetical protein
LPYSLEQGQINDNKEWALAQNKCIHGAKARKKNILLFPALVQGNKNARQ